MKELIEKRKKLLDEIEAMKEKRNVEKRAAFTNEERETVNAKLVEIDVVNAEIELENRVQEQRNKKLDLISVEAPAIVKNLGSSDVATEFRSFVNLAKSGEKFLIPFEKRATVTTSSKSHFSYTDQAPNLSINDSELVLGSLGVKTWYFESGSQDFPSISEIVASEGTQDSQVADQTLTSAKITLSPTFQSASLEPTKVFLKNSKPENIQHLINELQYAVQKRVEKKTIDSFINVAPITSGTTGIVTSFHNASVQLEKAIKGTPTGYIFSQHGFAKGKVARKDSGSGEFCIKDGMLNGYPVKRSTLMVSGDTAGYLITASAVAMAYWGEGITIEYITDATLGRKGNVLLLASALASGSYLDANKIAVIRNVDKLTT